MLSEHRRTGVTLAAVTALTLSGCGAWSPPTETEEPPPAPTVPPEPATTAPAESAPAAEPDPSPEATPEQETSPAPVTTPPPAPPSDEPPSWPDTLEQIETGVVRVSTADCEGPVGTGSGFLIDDTLIVTNAHVVDGAASVTVDETAVPAEIVGYSDAVDLALLRVSEPLDGHVFSWVEEHPRVGDEVWALGYPLGDGFANNEGGVSSLDPSGDFLLDSVRYIQTSALVNPGNSGGPLVTVEGEVAGVVFLKRLATDGGVPVEGIAYAISVDDAERMVEGWAESPQSMPLEECYVDPEIPQPVSDNEVQVTVASAHESAGAIAQTLALHGSAINDGQYDAAFDLFTPSLQDRVGGLDAWQAGLHTSFWRELVIEDVSGSGGELAARVWLATEQHPDYGWEGQTCSVLALDYVMAFEQERGIWTIDGVTSREDPQPC